MEATRLQEVLEKYLNNNCEPEEVRWLMGHFHTAAEDELMRLVMQHFNLNEQAPALNPDQQVLNEIYGRIQSQIGRNNHWLFARRLWLRITAAACILVSMSIGGYFLIFKPVKVSQTAQSAKHDFAPGLNRATLTLANGQKIYLSKSIKGKLAQQGSTIIQMGKDGAVTYDDRRVEKNIGGTVAYNTLTTKRGEEFPLILADGSKVMLNSASSITYPVVFNGTHRQVTVRGEAFFDIVHDAQHPFKVKVDNNVIEDIGTSFNINAYVDEPFIQTTMVTGSAKISTTQVSAILKPGRAAVSKRGSEQITIKKVDVAQALAWKNNYFLFEGDNLESIMRKVSRWYDVDVEYKDAGLKKQVFSGTVSRFKNVSSVLKKLEWTGAVHFELTGNKIIITK